MPFKIISAAFQQGQPIPPRHTGDGEDRSPPLTWSEPPQDTQQFALICDDPDAPSAEPWVHWVIYNLPADLTSLPEGIAHSERPPAPAGAVQGANSWPSGQTLGYRGPAPPPGKPHRYYFKLFALDKRFELTPGLSKNDLLQVIQSHILAEAQLMGTYQR